MANQPIKPLAHWGLERWPFPSRLGPAQFYPTAGHDEALARIDYLVEGGRRLGVLVGPPGVGKSLLLEVAARRFARAGKAVVSVDALGLSARDLVWQLAAGLKLAPRDDADAARLWRQVADRVTENRLQQIGTVLLVDDAGQAGPDALTQLIRLARLDLSPAAQWTIVLAAEAGQAARWEDSLRELVDLRIEVETWDESDTIGFVQNSLVDAGSTGPLFDQDALVAIHELADGVPRRVARLADFALLAGAAVGAEQVDAELVRAAHEEMAWPRAVGAYSRGPSSL